MSTKIRLQELHVMNNNIVGECNKMMQYLKMVKERSAYAITYLDSQNVANILRRFSATYEYLNRLYIKILDQNCAFELFFMELNELIPIDPNSAQYSAKCSTAESTYFDSTARNFTEPKQTLDSILYQNVHGCIPKGKVNRLNECTDNTSTNSSDIPRTKTTKLLAKTKNMNVYAAEFEPRSNSTNSSVCSGNDCSSISSKSDILEQSIKNVVPIIKPPSANTAETAKEKNRKNVALHHVPLHSYTNTRKKEENNEKVQPTIEKIEPEIKQDQCASTSNPETVKNNQEELDEPINSVRNDRCLTGATIRNVIKNINDRTREYELKTSVPIPDLRPKVIRNESDSTNSATVHVPKRISTQTKSDKYEFIPKKKNHTSKENHLKDQPREQQIVLKRGPPPKEGDLCCISSVESVSSFYIHVIRDDNTLIDCLSQQIAEICHSLKSFSNKRQLAKCINEYCVCYIPNYSSWCRVQITNWMMDHEQLVEVMLIDYGLSCKVSIKNIRAPIEYFFELPVMADKCELAWVKPLENRALWSTESITHFNKLIESSDRLFTISYVEEDEDHLIVDLQNNEINSVAGLMITDGKAAADDESDDGKQWTNDFMRKQIIRSQGFSEQELNQTEEDKLESLMYDEEDDEEVSNPNLAVSHYNPRDEKEICRIFLSRGYCFKGRHCTFSHTPLNPDGWTTDREAVFYDAFNPLQLPQSGDEVKLKVLNIVNLKTYYVTIKDLPECTNLIGMPIHSMRTLGQLLNDPKEVKTFKKMVVIPGLGEIILVNTDEIWQRARVLSIEEFANKVLLEVILVDNGKTRKINMKHCRKIEEKHLSLPFQAVLCSLSNVVLKDTLPEKANEMGTDYLEMNILNKKLTAKVVYASHYLNVHLFLENGQDIGEELIKAEIVNRCTTTFTAISGPGLLVD